MRSVETSFDLVDIIKDFDRILAIRLVTEQVREVLHFIPREEERVARAVETIEFAVFSPPAGSLLLKAAKKRTEEAAKAIVGADVPVLMLAYGSPPLWMTRRCICNAVIQLCQAFNRPDYACLALDSLSEAIAFTQETDRNSIRWKDRRYAFFVSSLSKMMDETNSVTSFTRKEFFKADPRIQVAMDRVDEPRQLLTIKELLYARNQAQVLGFDFKDRVTRALFERAPDLSSLIPLLSAPLDAPPGV